MSKYVEIPTRIALAIADGRPGGVTGDDRIRAHACVAHDLPWDLASMARDGLDDGAVDVHNVARRMAFRNAVEVHNPTIVHRMSKMGGEYRAAAAEALGAMPAMVRVKVAR